MVRVKRIIPCLDVKGGRVVKGVRFVDLRDMGDPIELAIRYEEEGADEITLLDITATIEGRSVSAQLIRDVASVLSIPLIVGGGIRSLEDFERALSAGADKVAIGTAALENPLLVREAAESFGSHAVVITIDAKRVEGRYVVYSRSGTLNTGVDAVEWAKRAEALGAGELLVTSIDRDGTRMGYDIEMTRAIAEAVRIPVIASGGAGSPEHFYEVLTLGKADAALAAGVFHEGLIRIRELKAYLASRGVTVRL